MERVLHLWVDPLYGDDSLAATFNPGPSCASDCGTGAAAPIDVVDPNTGSLLLHASQPFKTITAAVDSIWRLSPNSTTPPLPYQSAIAHQFYLTHYHVDYTVRWTHAIIHLLPGMYHPDGGTRDPVNGLRRNGETFPIWLPPHVSIQGTSALNTVLDLDGFTHHPTDESQSYAAFEFGVFYDPMSGQPLLDPESPGVPVNGEDTFIDSVTIMRGGRSAVGWRHLAGVLVYHHTAARPTISNCFFLFNDVGILVSAGEGQPDPDDPVVHDGLTIVNNTFAGNQIGVWNGQAGPDRQDVNSLSVLAIGLSKLIVLNNVFDGGYLDPNIRCGPSGVASGAWPSTWTGTVPVSDFEGLCAEDMSVQVGANPTVYENFNAFEVYGQNPSCRRYNQETHQVNSGSILTNLRVTSLRTTNDPTPTTNGHDRNIAPFTGYQGAFQSGSGCSAGAYPGFVARGVLYVRDLICWGADPNAGAASAFPIYPEFDRSPMDFRLSPTAYLAQPSGISVPPAQAQANPLIDAGWAGPFPGTMQNGLTIASEPGRLPLSGVNQVSWGFHCWTHDCEGYGNPRIVDDPFAPNAPANNYREIDLGADEANGLIIAGYRYGTTSFVKIVNNPPTGIPLMINDAMFYIGKRGTGVLQNTSQGQPWYRYDSLFAADARWPWPLLPVGFPTAGVHAAETWFQQWSFSPAASGPYLPTVSDVMPYLLPDPHPWWVPAGLGASPAIVEWKHCVPGTTSCCTSTRAAT